MTTPLSDTPEFAAAVEQRIRATSPRLAALHLFLFRYARELRRALNKLKGAP